MRKLGVFTSVLIALCSGVVCESELLGQTAPPATPSQEANPAFSEIKDDAALPRVLLVGDSISIGYTLSTRTRLEGKANVHRIPVNGGPTIRGLESLDQWLGSGKWDVIHFNWGLHDLRFMDDGKHQVAIEAYEKNLRELVGRLKRTGAVLIWASTTPVPDAEVTPPRKSRDVIAYNAAAKRVMDENAIPINDLYTVALPQLSTIQLPANVHYTDAGYDLLGERLAAAIREVLDTRR